MASRRIFIKEEQIKEELPAIQLLIKDKNLFDTFQIVDRGPYGFTILNLQILGIVEASLAVLVETAKQMENVIIEDRGRGFDLTTGADEKSLFFIYLFSIYAAMAEGMERCSLLMEKPPEIKDTFKKNEIENFIKKTIMMSAQASFTTDMLQALPGEFLKDYLDYIVYFRDHGDPSKRLKNSQGLLERSMVYFMRWKNTIMEIAADSQFDLFREELGKLRVEIFGKIFEGFSYSPGDSAEGSQLMEVDTADIIGNADYIRAAARLARDVAGFDLKTWENPKKINPILFALGSPGCGKTITAHAVGNYFTRFCRERGIRSKFVIIRRTDWASSYQNASASRLLDVFRENVLGYKGVVGIYWPDIDTAFAARSDSQVRNEEKNILGAVFGLFDGTILPKNGQWFMLCDANYLNMDKATISRITQDPYYVKGPQSPEDFIRLFRDIKLSKHREFVDFTEEQWMKVGEFCSKNQLSGRSIDNISRKVISTIEDFEFPEEYYKADIERKREIIREYSNRMAFPQLEEILEHYVKFEKEAEDKASKKRFEDRVQEITTYMSAKKHVLTTLENQEEANLPE